MKNAIAALSAVFISTTAALASGPVQVLPEAVVPMVPMSAPWQGFYAGASLGVGTSNYDLGGRYTAPGTSIGLNLPDLGGEGMVFALQGGYNFQLSNRWVGGLQLDATATNITNDTSLTGLPIGGGSVLNANYDLQVRSMYTFSGRIGYLATPDTMIYGLLGATRGNFRGAYSLDINGGAPVASGSYDFSLNGASIGVGLETRLTDRTTLGLEYRYSRMGRYSFYDGTVGGGDNLEVGFDTNIHTVRAMLNVHF